MVSSCLWRETWARWPRGDHVRGGAWCRRRSRSVKSGTPPPLPLEAPPEAPATAPPPPLSRTSREGSVGCHAAAAATPSQLYALSHRVMRALGTALGTVCAALAAAARLPAVPARLPAKVAAEAAVPAMAAAAPTAPPDATAVAAAVASSCS